MLAVVYLNSKFSDTDQRARIYIDWRESFGGSTKGGDVYYDLAKLYGGCIIPYNLMKEESQDDLQNDTRTKY